MLCLGHIDVLPYFLIILMFYYILGHRRTGSAVNDSLREDAVDMETNSFITELSALLRLMQVSAGFILSTSCQ